MQIRVAVVAALAFLVPAFGGPIFLVVPTANTSTPGNTNDDIEAGPFDIHVQQVFARGQFLSSGVSGPLLISQFAFRAAPDTGPASLSITSVDIYASTSSYAPNTNPGNTLITDTFATNLGPDNTLVFSGPLALSSPGCAGPSVCPFDFVVTFDTPFLYNPTQGFLLLDLQILGLSGSGSLDAQRFNSPGEARMAIVVGLLGDLTGEVFTEGNITRFTYEGVPEPMSMLLLGSGLALLVFRSRLRKRG